MIKSILIPLDPSPYTDSAIQMGIMLAGLHNAQLTGLVVLDIKGIQKSVGPVPLGTSYYAEKLEEKHMKQAQERIALLVDKFEQKCKNMGITYKIARNQGSPSERIIRESIFFDLVIAGLRTHYQFETNEKHEDSLSDLLHASVTPIVGVPQILNLPDMTKERMKVLILFDSSPSSARGLQRFAQLALPEKTDIKILMSDPNKAIATAALEHAAEYLKLHGFSQVEITWTKDPIRNACRKKYVRLVDIVVMGAHSKHGVFDFMVGSMTNCIIKLDKIPVVIGQ